MKQNPWATEWGGPSDETGKPGSRVSEVWHDNDPSLLPERW
jgi:hypothetical protein